MLLNSLGLICTFDGDFGLPVNGLPFLIAYPLNLDAGRTLIYLSFLPIMLALLLFCQDGFGIGTAVSSWKYVSGKPTLVSGII